MATEYRIFTEDDFEELRQMVTALYEEDSYGEPMSEEKVRRTVSEFRHHPDKGQIMLFCEDKQVVGYAILIFFWSNEHGGDTVFIDEIYIRPQWRNRGISSNFILYLSSSPYKAIQVEVTPSNEKSLAFFLRQGFRADDNRYLWKVL